MFLRLVADSFTRRPKRKLLTLAALALGMAVATAALSVSLDVGDRLAQEFRSLGANLLVTPEADSLPLEIGGVDYRPANAGAYLPEADLGKLKTIFWRHNIVGFAPILEAPAIFVKGGLGGGPPEPPAELQSAIHGEKITLIGTWVHHVVQIPDGTVYTTGVESTNPWWRIEGRWFAERANEVVIGNNLAKRVGLGVGSEIVLGMDSPGFDTPWPVKVVGILSSGAAEDNAIVAPLDVTQSLAGKPGQYRRLYVSALTKPEDAFGRRDPKSMTQEEFDRWYCSPYISAIALQM